MKKMLTPKQAAPIMGCSASHARYLCRTGKIKCKKMPLEFGGFVYLIPLMEARRYNKTPQESGWPRGQTYTLH